MSDLSPALVFSPLVVWVACAAFAAPAAAQDWATAQFARQISTEERTEVLIRYSAGTLTLSGTSTSQLYGMRLRYNADTHEPTHEFDGSRVTLGIDGIGRNSFLRSGSTDGEMEVLLTTRIPMDLTLDLGAVRATMDVGGLRLTNLEVRTGASEGELRVSVPNPEEMESVDIKAGAASFRAIELGNLNAANISLDAGVGDFRLDLSGLRRSETNVTVKMGLGSLELRAPSDVGIRLTRRSFLTSLNAPGLERRGDTHYSSNWDQATVRVNIAVEAALGSIAVIRTNP